MAEVYKKFKNDITLLHNMFNNLIYILQSKKRELSQLLLKINDFDLKVKINNILNLIDEIKDIKEKYDYTFNTLKISEPSIVSNVIDFFYSAFVDNTAKTQKDIYKEKIEELNDRLITKKIIELDNILQRNDIELNDLRKNILKIINKYIKREIFIKNKISPVKYIDLIITSLFINDPNYILLNNYTEKIFNKKQFEDFKKELLNLSYNDIVKNNILKWNINLHDEKKQIAKLLYSFTIYSNNNDIKNELNSILKILEEYLLKFINNYNKFEKIIKDDILNIDAKNDEYYSIYVKFFENIFDKSNMFNKLLNNLYTIIKS